MLDAVVVGAGQAGLATSYWLTQRNLTHTVLECGRIGESWLSQRWDSFVLNTPTSLSLLPGDSAGSDDPDGFLTRDTHVARCRAYVERFALPVREGARVLEVTTSNGGFVVRVEGDSSPIEARNVVVASGSMQAAKRPLSSTDIPSAVTALHASEYRNPAALPPGAVLVVGAAQSGCQIAEDLLAAGRHVYLATSRVSRAPRRYRGRDIFAWLDAIGFLAQGLKDLPDPGMRYMTQPQISGVGPRGHTVSLQWLAEQGVILLGRFEGYRDDHLHFANDVGANVRFADEASARLRGLIDGAIARLGLDASPADIDPIDLAHPSPETIESPSRLKADEVGSVIWCTGFVGGFPWLKVPTLNADGQPEHTGGVSKVPGIYFMGLPWQTARRSALILGAGEDARLVVEHLAARAS